MPTKIIDSDSIYMTSSELEEYIEKRENEQGDLQKLIAALGIATVGACTATYAAVTMGQILGVSAAISSLGWAVTDLQEYIEDEIDINYLKNTALPNLSKGFAKKLKMTTTVKQWVSSNGNSSSGAYVEVSFKLIY